MMMKVIVNSAIQRRKTCLSKQHGKKELKRPHAEKNGLNCHSEVSSVYSQHLEYKCLSTPHITHKENLWKELYQISNIRINTSLEFFNTTHSNIWHIATERKGERKKWCKREASIDCLPYLPGPGIMRAQAGDGTHNLGVCPDWKSNPQPCGCVMTCQLIEPHWPGHIVIILNGRWSKVFFFN